MSATNPETNERFLARLLAGDFLLWSPNIQAEGFANWDRIFATRTIEKAPTASPLPPGEPITDVAFEAYGERGDVESLMRDEHLSGLLVVQDGAIRLERYAKGLTPSGRWQSSSMVKSLASILVAAAEQDGLLSRADPVTDHLADFAGTAYAQVTIEHLLTMSSGIEWTENTDDIHSDVAERYIKVIGARQAGAIQEYLKTRQRAAEPGTSFYYNTGDTFLLGLILAKATGKTVAEYCSQKVWQPMGMEQPGFFMLDGDDGQEVVGSCCGACLRDYARWGLLMLNDGVAADGTRVVPEGWVAKATSPQAPAFAFDFSGVRGTSSPPMAEYAGYGYLWWIKTDGAYQALGSYGQWLHVDPARGLVVVLLGAVPRIPYLDPDSPEVRAGTSHMGSARRARFIDAVAARCD
ncbi:serine hydrolase domain-containing protein [Crossiella sp. NPDC003009]